MSPVDRGYVWKIPTPFRVLSFCWVACLDKVLASDELKWHNHILTSGCILCLHNAEDDLFTVLPLPRCGTLLFNYLVDWVRLGSIKDLFDHWKYGFGSYRGKVV